MLGGAATHFALAASFFDEVRAVGPVGDDFDEATGEVLRTRGTVTDDVEHVAGGKTFFWKGEYSTTSTSARRSSPTSTSSSPSSRSSRRPPQDGDVLFLANIQPDLQLDVREQCARRASWPWTR